MRRYVAHTRLRDGNDKTYPIASISRPSTPCTRQHRRSCWRFFVNGGLYNSTHNAPSSCYRDYVAFVHRFVADFGCRCVDLVHADGKKAFVFYDDHWVGVEPYGPHFHEIGFDGLTKRVFNAFEVRKCAGVSGVTTHELRLHPYPVPHRAQGRTHVGVNTPGFLWNRDPGPVVGVNAVTAPPGRRVSLPDSPDFILRPRIRIKLFD